VGRDRAAEGSLGACLRGHLVRAYGECRVGRVRTPLRLRVSAGPGAQGRHDDIAFGCVTRPEEAGTVLDAYTVCLEYAKERLVAGRRRQFDKSSFPRFPTT
jgi:hypothetical protein